MKRTMTTAEISKYAILAYYNQTLLEQGLITRREFVAMGRKIDQMQEARL